MIKILKKGRKTMFDNRLIKLREEMGKSKKEVAKALNLPYTTYSNYEADLREPSSETLIKIADYYGVSIDYLLGYNQTKESSKMTRKEISAFLEEKVTLVIPNGVWNIIRDGVTDFIDRVGEKNLRINLKEMIVPVFENEEQKSEWLSKMFEAEKTINREIKSIIKEMIDESSSERK